MKRALLCATIGAALPAMAHADILWTGTSGPNIFFESNWDLTGSSVTTIDENVPIQDNVVFRNSAQPARVPAIGGGQWRFEVAEGFKVTIDNMRVWSSSDDGFGSSPGSFTGIEIDVINGGLFEPAFIVYAVNLNIDGTSRVIFGDAGNPVNLSTVNMTLGASLEFLREDPTEFMNEHLSKITVDGAPAILGQNINATYDGVQGTIVTVIPQPVGTNYCNANPNSTLVPAVMRGFGSASASSNALTVECFDMPRFVFGFFITGRTPGFAANPAGSDGNLCLGGSIGRFVGPGQITNSGTEGRIELEVDLTTLPQPTGFVSGNAGEAWHFQVWFRDAGQGGGVGSNFSDGLRVQLL